MRHKPAERVVSLRARGTARRSRARRTLIGALALATLFALAVFATGPAAAQGFGQNKITYMDFDWEIYRSPHFDVHFYDLDRSILEQVVNEAESAYLDLSRRLDHDIKNRIPLVLYRTHAEFEQTNISLSEIPEGVGGFSEPFQNRMVIPIDDPPDMRYFLIRHELVHIFQFDIFYAGSLRRAIRSSAPLWLMEGMASYLADDEDSFDQMVIRDVVVNNIIPSIRELDVQSFLTYRYGHAIFDFIESSYGSGGMRNFLFEFRKSLLSPDPEKAFQDAFGLSVTAFDRRFARFLRQRYLPVLTDKRAPEDYGREIGLTRPGRFTFSPALSPSGELIAALATPKLEVDVVILSAKDGKVVRNLTSGFTSRYESIVTEAWSGPGQRDLSWSPDGDRLAFFVTRENYRQLMVYEVLTGSLVAKIPFRDISDCASPAFSPDGKTLAFSGNKGGYWDIFRYDLETKQVENITQDEYYDSSPTWSADGRTILYNRRIGSFEKIFSVTVGTPERKIQLTGGACSDVQPMFSRDAKVIYFSSDRGAHGIFNLHRLDVATGRIERLTDLTGGAFTPAEMASADNVPVLAYTSFFGGTWRLFRVRLAGPEVQRAIAVGEKEPATSPLAPSRRAAFAAEKKRRMAAEPPPVPDREPGEGGPLPLPTRPAPPPTPPTNPPTDPPTTPPPGSPGGAGTSGGGGGLAARLFGREATSLARAEATVAPLRAGATLPGPFTFGNTARSFSDGFGTFFGRRAEPFRPMETMLAPGGASAQQDQVPPSTPPAPPAGPPADPPAEPRAEPAVEPAAEPPPEDDRPDADLRPFTPPLQLGLDPNRFQKYKVKWDIDSPTITVGATNDGTILTDIAVNFSDLLGDQRVAVRSFSISDYSNLEVTYLNLKRRIDWGATIFDYRDYYLAAGGFSVDRLERRQRLTSLTAFAQYPFNRHYRVEGSIGYAQRRLAYPQFVPIDENTVTFGFREFSDDYPVASLGFVGDTTRYQEWGPFQGKRFRVSVSGLKFTGGESSGETVTSVDFDFRGYQHVTSRSLLAFHLAGIRASGERAPIYALGGINQLRGYEFREFFGTSVAWANLEYRFPLIDELAWGFGASMGPFRGFVFADIGSAWFEDVDHVVCLDPGCSAFTIERGKAAYDPRLGTLRKYDATGDGRWVDLHGSVGLGFHVPILGLPFTWSFAKRYDGDEFSGYSSSFYIVFDW